MTKRIPGWFTALFVAVLILCCAVVAASVFREASLRAQIADAQSSLTTAQGRLRKQQQEYAEYTAALPEVLEALAVVEPQATAAYDQEQALRQQRKELRAENADLADQIALLQAQFTGSDADLSQTLDALMHLQNALQDLRALHQLDQ